MSELRFNNSTVSDVTGISKSRLFEAASRLGIRTNGKGYSVDQVKAIQHVAQSHSNRNPNRFGSADQLREALAVH